MVKLNKIYTKTGDDGTTALATGARLPKNDLRIECYGTVDELNAIVGIARHGMDGEVDAMLARIQNDLFDLGADFATPDPADGTELPFEPLRITAAQVTRLEQELDQLNANMAPLESFILPGGALSAAHLHHARTVCRRAERVAVALKTRGEPINPAAVTYLNRLSDFFFVAARYENDKGNGDVLWVPGATRN